jgi:hypothetical protein
MYYGQETPNVGMPGDYDAARRDAAEYISAGQTIAAAYSGDAWLLLAWPKITLTVADAPGEHNVISAAK